MVGQFRLLQRLWRNVVDETTGQVTVVDTEPDEDTLRALHKAIDGVRQDLEGLRFNTAIAKITELNNHLTKTGAAVPRSVAESLVLLIAPLAPHIAEELWRRLGRTDSVVHRDFPVADPAYVVDETVTCVVQIKGRSGRGWRFPLDLRGGTGEGGAGGREGRRRTGRRRDPQGDRARAEAGQHRHGLRSVVRIGPAGRDRASRSPRDADMIRTTGPGGPQPSVGPGGAAGSGWSLRAGSGFRRNPEPARYVYRGSGATAATAGRRRSVVEAVLTVIVLLFCCASYSGVCDGEGDRSGQARCGPHHRAGRRTVEETTLRARTLAQPGPAGEIAALRLTLRTSMRATQEALHAGAVEDESLKESLGLFNRLSAHGYELDAELKRLEIEPDRGTVASRLPELRERTERITHSADSLRWAAHDRARRFADDDLDTLSAQIDVEAGALRHWTTEEPTAPSWPEAPAPRPPTAGPGRRPPAPRASWEQPTRPAIGPRGQRPAYSWQKKPRPESTP